MSNVTGAEIIVSVAQAYGMAADAVRAGSHRLIASHMREHHRMAQATAIYLMWRHMGLSVSSTCLELGIAYNASSRKLIKAAILEVGDELSSDSMLRRRLDVAEEQIDDYHERRWSAGHGATA